MPLPAPWNTIGRYTYWEGFLHVQDEIFIDLTIENCSDDEGNGRLDIVQVFDPQGEVIIDERNLGGNPIRRIYTYQQPGYYRIFLQDLDTTGNGGALKVQFLKDQKVYLNAH